MQDEEFIQSFVEEAKAHIEIIENELMQMDFEAIDMESINTIFRSVHTIKGTSGFFDFKAIVSLSHALENLFNEMRSGTVVLTNSMVDVLLKANDCLRVMVDDVMASEDIDISKHVSELNAFINGHNVASIEESPQLEDSEHYFDLERYLSSEEKDQLIRAEVKRGSRLYVLKRAFKEDLLANHAALSELLKEIASLGNVIEFKLGLESFLSEASNGLETLNAEVLFTTVLEPDFLPPVIGEPVEDLVEWQIKPINEKSKTAMMPSQSDDTLDISSAKPVGEELHREEASSDAPLRDKAKAAAISGEDSVRVNVNLLNGLLNLSGEMVLARNQLFRKMENHRKEIPGIEVIFQNINHITTNLQETIMQTRMQPVSNVFSKFPRIAREISKKLEKDLALELEGTHVELDKSIVEALGDPLTHLVRNAIDHGMELPEERLRLEKPRTGTIKLKAYHESGYVNIDVIDDGKGINTEIIRRKAYEKGFISKTDVDILGEQESLQLLFKPGFSTAEAVTDLSGRGVGMDVVKTNIEKLGGKIEIFTTLGQGTTFRLLLPLTLAIIPSLIIEAEKQKFALPQINVQEIVRIKANDPGRKIEFINNAEVLRLRGRLLPIVRLSDVLGLKRTFVDPTTGERVADQRQHLFHVLRQPEMETQASQLLSEREDRRGYKLTNIIRILVIKIGARRLGLAVDTIHGSEEILVKTLPAHIKGCNNYSGVTILGDGKVAMILDPSGIIENANLRYIDDRIEANNKLLVSEADKMREHQNLLLFKCSGPEILALDMAMISRVEEISSADIERIGDKEYIKFRGEPLRIVRPEDFILSRPSGVENVPNQKYSVIIPKLVKHPMGILIEKVQDTMQTSIHLTGNGSITSKGLIGSTIIGDRIVLLLNLYELFELANPEQYAIATPTKQKAPLKVLLVEDTPFFQKLEKDYLENAGYQVTVADNGKIAFQKLLEQSFDIVVSDIVMPEMNGLELIKRIRADQSLAQLPVIAVTSLTGAQQIKEGLAAGFDAYEFKLDRSRLLEVIGLTMDKRGKQHD